MQRNPDPVPGGALRQARMDAGLSVKQLARLARPDGPARSATAFYDAEAGRRKPSLRLIQLYAYHCNAPKLLEELAHDSEVPDDIELLLSLLFERGVTTVQNDAKDRLAATFETRLASSDSQYVRLEGSEEMLAAALYLLRAPEQHSPNQTAFVLQSAPRLAVVDFQDDRRHLYQHAIRTFVSSGARLIHVIPREALSRQPADVALRRYAELISMSGDYVLYRDNAPVRMGFTDTIIRPGVGVLQAIAADSMAFVASSGHFFGAAYEDYVNERAAQALVRAEAKVEPFIVHESRNDPVGGTGLGLETESALADLEEGLGPRILLKDGASDLLMPSRTLEATMAALRSDQRTRPEDSARMERDMERVSRRHAQRVRSFKSSIVDHDYTDFVPRDSLVQYSNSGRLSGAPLRGSAGQLQIDPELARAHLAAMADFLEIVPRFRLIMLDSPLSRAIRGSGLTIITKEIPAQDEWAMFFETVTPVGGGHRSSAFSTREDRYRKMFAPALNELVKRYKPTFERNATIEYLRRLARGI